MTAWGAASLVQMVSNIQPYENANPGSPLQIGRNLSISLQARTSTAFRRPHSYFQGGFCLRARCSLQFQDHGVQDRVEPASPQRGAR